MSRVRVSFRVDDPAFRRRELLVLGRFEHTVVDAIAASASMTIRYARTACKPTGSYLEDTARVTVVPCRRSIEGLIASRGWSNAEVFGASTTGKPRRCITRVEEGDQPPHHAR